MTEDWELRETKQILKADARRIAKKVAAIKRKERYRNKVQAQLHKETCGAETKVEIK